MSEFEDKQDLQIELIVLSEQLFNESLNEVLKKMPDYKEISRMSKN